MGVLEEEGRGEAIWHAALEVWGMLIEGSGQFDWSPCMIKNKTLRHQFGGDCDFYPLKNPLFHVTLSNR
jgi:hypothetical protein